MALQLKECKILACCGGDERGSGRRQSLYILTALVSSLSLDEHQQGESSLVSDQLLLYNFLET